MWFVARLSVVESLESGCLAGEMVGWFVLARLWVLMLQLHLAVFWFDAVLSSWQNPCVFVLL